MRPALSSLADIRFSRCPIHTERSQPQISYMDTFLSDENHEHMVMPGMVYIYSRLNTGRCILEELTALSEASPQIPSSALCGRCKTGICTGCPENTVSLKDLARLCDVFYIGGTKCGALWRSCRDPRSGTDPAFLRSLNSTVPCSAKGRILGIQFDVLFTDDLYLHIGESALNYADSIKTY